MTDMTRDLAEAQEELGAETEADDALFQLLRDASALKLYEDKEEQPTNDNLLTEQGLAYYFAHKHSAALRSVPERGTWLFWSGHHWQPDTIGEVERQVQNFLQRLYVSANPDQAKIIKRAMTGSKVNSIKGLARVRKSIKVRVADLDNHEHLLATPTGTVNLRTGKAQDPDPGQLITKRTGVGYDAKATAPRWHQFLDEVTEGDEEMQGYLQRLVGYLLTGSIKEQRLYIFYGPGGNGKDTFFDALREVMGDHAGLGAPSLLAYDAHNRHPAEIADLQGVRLAVHAEMEDGQRMAEAKVKQLTGQGTLKARLMRQDFSEFPNITKHVLLTNHLPRIQGDDYAMARRLMVLPFSRVFTEEERDLELPRKLKQEAKGILAWAVEGAEAYYAEGLKEVPEKVTKATKDYLVSNDPLGLFLDECLDLQPGSNSFASNTDLRAALHEWSDTEMAGLFRHPDAKAMEAKLWKRLSREGCLNTKRNVPKPDGPGRTTQRGWQGVEVKA